MPFLCIYQPKSRHSQSTILRVGLGHFVIATKQVPELGFLGSINGAVPTIHQTTLIAETRCAVTRPLRVTYRSHYSECRFRFLTIASQQKAAGYKHSPRHRSGLIMLITIHYTPGWLIFIQISTAPTFLLILSPSIRKSGSRFMICLFNI